MAFQVPHDQNLAQPRGSSNILCIVFYGRCPAFVKGDQGANRPAKHFLKVPRVRYRFVCGFGPAASLIMVVRLLRAIIATDRGVYLGYGGEAITQSGIELKSLLCSRTGTGVGDRGRSGQHQLQTAQVLPTGEVPSAQISS
jgi:hypothetical protein